MTSENSALPARLQSQEVPSTNTVAIMVQSVPEGDVRGQMYSLCQFAIGGKENEIQCIDFDQFDSSRLVRVTFFDVRNAYKCQQWLADDARFSTVLDFKGGTNRSVVIPKMPGLSIDVLFDRFSGFGEIEKIWFTADSIVIDFFDSRAPIRIVEHLEDAANSARQRPPAVAGAPTISIL